MFVFTTASCPSNALASSSSPALEISVDFDCFFYGRDAFQCFFLCDPATWAPSFVRPSVLYSVHVFCRPLLFLLRASWWFQNPNFVVVWAKASPDCGRPTFCMFVFLPFSGLFFTTCDRWRRYNDVGRLHPSRTFEIPMWRPMWVPPDFE